MSDSDNYPKAEFFPKPNLSKNLPNVPKFGLFRSFDWAHDMIIVKWREVTLIQFFRKPNLFEYLPNVPKCGLNTRHDNREETLIHLTRAQILRSDKCATGSIHTNGSTTINVISCQLFCRSCLCLVPSAIHLRSKLQATIIFACITIHKKDILKNFLCIWWWQMLWLKHVLSRKL